MEGGREEPDLEAWEGLIGPRFGNTLDQQWTNDEIVNYHRYWMRWGAFREKGVAVAEEDITAKRAPTSETKPRARLFRKGGGGTLYKGEMVDG
jgi:hypothetical protein